MHEDNDPFGLRRFLNSQQAVYMDALQELKKGRKLTHWMWFIFPQIDGLGYSPTTKFYSIKSLGEARHYLSHPVLGKRLIDCAETILTVQGRTAHDIFGYPDDLKLKSSMTLFEYVSGIPNVFARVLDQYFDGDRDQKTLDILKEMHD